MPAIMGTEGKSNTGGAHILSDVKSGWIFLSNAAENATAITDMNDAPSDAVSIPDDGSTIMVQLMSVSAGAVVAQIYLYPPDPGTDTTAANARLNTGDGVAAGWLAATVSQTTINTKTADSLFAVAVTDLCCGTPVVIDRAGAAKIAARITTISGTSTQAKFRVY